MIRGIGRHVRAVILAASLVGMPAAARAERFEIARDGAVRCAIVVDVRGSPLSQPTATNTTGVPGTDAYSLVTWGRFLAEQLGRVTGTAPEVRLGPAPAAGRSIVIGLAENYPAIARTAGLDAAARAADPVRHYDAFGIHSTADTLYLLGHTELGCRHAVATLLEVLGFRYYAPSPRWWIAPRTRELAVDESRARAPTFFNVEFATNAGHHLNHGNGTETYLWDIQEIWYAMNRTAGLRFNPGPRFSAGPFAFDFTRRVQAELATHPEYFAQLPDGGRDVDRPLPTRHLCVSNPRIVALIAADRVAQLTAARERDRFRPTISGEYSSGPYADCRCDACARLGTSVDREFYVINAIARAVRDKFPDALVATRVAGPARPVIALEPNVCVSVSRREFAPAWAEQAALVGIAHGLPEYVPGGPADRSQQLETYQDLARFARQHRVQSLVAPLAPAWGGRQTPLLYGIAQVFWDPAVDVEPLMHEYFALSFGRAAAPMRVLWEQWAVQDWRDDATLRSGLDALAQAYAAEDRADVRERVVDVMAYVHGLILYREFVRVQEREPGRRSAAFYDALRPVLQFLSRNSYRSILCPAVLAQRHCNRTALEDGREDFYWYRFEKAKPPVDPVWMDPGFPWRPRPLVVRRDDPRVAATFHDDEIVELFARDRQRFGAVPSD